MTYLCKSPYENDGGNLIGKRPSEIGVSDLRALGHPESPIKAIRAFCVECGGNEAEARKCTAYDCQLWPLRMGRNPFHGKKPKT
jgi:hypothetical protein